MDVDDVEEGDHILFQGRKQPLEVVKAGEEKLLVEGPHGGEYAIFPAPDNPEILLVSKPGNRRYASKVENLRVVGRWERDGESWEHTGTGATIEIVENDAGNWTLEIEGLEDVELPLYGFLEKSGAVNEAEEIVRKNPEGNPSRHD